MLFIYYGGDLIFLIAICVFALYYLLNSCFCNKTNEGFQNDFKVEDPNGTLCGTCDTICCATADPILAGGPGHYCSHDSTKQFCVIP